MGGYTPPIKIHLNLIGYNPWNKLFVLMKTKEIILRIKVIGEAVFKKNAID